MSFLNRLSLKIRLSGSIAILLVLIIGILTLILLNLEQRTMNGITKKINIVADNIQTKQLSGLSTVEEDQLIKSEKELKEHLRHFVELLANISSLPISTYDTGMLNSFCKEAIHHDEVVLCYITDLSGDIYSFYNKIENIDLKGKEQIEGYINNISKKSDINKETLEIIQDNKTIGDVILLYSTEEVNNDKIETENIFNSIKTNTKEIFGHLDEELNSMTVTQLNYTKFLLFLIATIGIFVAMIITYIIINTITKPLSNIARVIKKISEGDTSETVEVKSSDEIGALSSAIATMVSNLNDMTNVAKRISEGDFSINYKPRSVDDVLGNAIEHMTIHLKEATQENKRQDWLKTGQAGLYATMRGELDIMDLAQNIINYITPYLNAQVGAIYVTDDFKTLKMVGSYAYTKRKKLSNEIEFGEGLAGQAALEKKNIIITEVPDNYMNINSGLGEVSPKNILVTPLVYENKVLGVIEIGSLYEFEEDHIHFMSLISENISIAFISSNSRNYTNTLLEKTQQQAQELQVQQEELRITNEELEEHTKALKESEANLQIKHEELQKIHAELEEHTELLELQKNEIKQKNIEIEKKALEIERTSKYKSEFLANMSHELRTPLNSLLILSKYLYGNNEGNLTEKQIEYAKTVYSAGNDLLLLINDILDLSKVESGKLNLNIEDILVSEIPVMIKQTFMPLVQNKNLSLDVDIETGLPEVIRSDPQRINQIIKNLLSNAVKFTHEGGITVTLFRPDSQKGIHVIGLDLTKAIAISVKDTGIGIPEDKKKIIFNAFLQADGSINRKYGGTGLGLSISKELAKLLGGDIELYSVEGKGSTFTLYLPIVYSNDQKSVAEPEKSTLNRSGQESVQEKQPEGDSVQQGNNRSTRIDTDPIDIELKISDFTSEIPDDRKDIGPNDKSILIIEDDTKFLKILLDTAHEKGYKCLIAEDGETGLQFADYYQPDAIILDIHLPGIDGWTVMERLKNNHKTINIPVHFISCDNNRLEALRMGAVGFLKKPVTMKHIDSAFHKIEDIISRDIKRLLIVDDNEEHCDKIRNIIDSKNINITVSNNIKDTYEYLKYGNYDCIILNPFFKNDDGFDLIKKLRNYKEILLPPILIYSSGSLTEEQESTIYEYAKEIVIKKIRTPDVLLDEIMLFLHIVGEKLSKGKQSPITMMHDKESVMQDKKILIVDDDIRNVFALSSILEEKGVNVFVGKNGKEGIECLSENPDVDLILMDIMMPVMDGYEAMKEIRKQKRFENIPIIALTAKAMKGDRKKCLDSGASDYLAKPVDINRLLSMLRVWLYNN